MSQGLCLELHPHRAGPHGVMGKPPATAGAVRALAGGGPVGPGPRKWPKEQEPQYAIPWLPGHHRPRRAWGMGQERRERQKLLPEQRAPCSTDCGGMEGTQVPSLGRGCSGEEGVTEWGCNLGLQGPLCPPAQGTHICKSTPSPRALVRLALRGQHHFHA